MNLVHDILLVSKVSEDQKKGRHQKWNSFFPNSGEDQKKKKRYSPKFFPNSNGDLRSHAHQSQIIGGDADEDHIKIIGGIQSNY